MSGCLWRGVVPQHFEAGMRQQMRDIGLRAGKKIIDAQDVLALRDQAVAQMRTKKTGASGDEDLFQLTPVSCPPAENRHAQYARGMVGRRRS
jgi:hypothetical protein